MLKIISYIFNKTGAVFNRASRIFYFAGSKTYSKSKSLSEQNKVRWYQLGGDKTLRVEYPLNSDSVVFDIGGYEGDWAAEIASRYNCTIYVFEPVLEFAEKIRGRFKNNPKIKVFSFGLGMKDEQLEIAVMLESSSVYRDKSQRHLDTVRQQVSLRNFNGFVSENNISKVDLIKINIEGGEYDLLESMIESGFVKNVTDIQVQFHDFVDRADERMAEVKRKLSITHALTYEYVYVWENWKKKIN